jgi:hypothetical protein
MSNRIIKFRGRIYSRKIFTENWLKTNPLTKEEILELKKEGIIFPSLEKKPQPVNEPKIEPKNEVKKQ